MSRYGRSNYTDDTTSELAYDLRQRYAQIVGDHLVAVSTARINSDYPKYYRLLKCLYTICSHNIDKFIKHDEKEKKPVYKDYLMEANKVINQFPQEYLGNTHNEHGVAQVENVLLKLEKYLLAKMKKANMFGESRYDDGL